VARENADTHQLKVEFFKSDWFDAIPYHDFSVIVSNPPYIATGDEHLDKTSLPFEPKRALTSGIDGLDDIRKICRGACNYLVKQGYLVLEHGYDQGQSVRDIMTKEGFSSVRTIKDLGGNDRVTLGQML
ncbi:MAG: HemK/PrmC family methyltransferase, partial [Succinivibrio sp.]